MGWVVVAAEPSPDACFAYGEPFGPEGASVHSCPGQGSTDRCIRLYTLVLASLAVHTDVHLRVGGGLPCWTSPVCPMILTGDKPCDPTCQCHPGEEIVVNPVNDHSAVGVASRRSSNVRALYRAH